MIPSLKATLYPHQHDGVKYALEHPYHINGFEMGLGKTVTALAVACIVNKPTLIICPAFLIANWKAEIEKFTEGLNVDIISYNQLSKVEKAYGIIIADEVHYIKNISAKRTKALHNLVMDSEPQYFMGLSGTPIKNRVTEFYSLLQLCHYGKHYPEFKSFHRRPYSFYNCFAVRSEFKVNGYPITKYDGLKNLDDLKTLIAPVYIRRKAKDVLDLPKQVRNEISLKNKTIHNNRLAEAWDAYSEGKVSDHLMSIKAVNALAKINDTVNLAKDILDQGEKIIVFTDHVDSAHAIAKGLGTIAITGQMGVGPRALIVHAFDTMPHCDRIVATIGSLSVGVNLTKAKYMIFNDLPWVPTDLAQAEKRIHRIGQEHTCFYYYMFNSDVDRQIYRVLTSKLKITKEF